MNVKQIIGKKLPAGSTAIAAYAAVVPVQTLFAADDPNGQSWVELAQ